MEPPPTKVVLELDGDDLGKRILQAVEPVKTVLAERAQLQFVPVPAGQTVTWEAEAGAVQPGMARGKDAMASGGTYVWMPGESGGEGSGGGSVYWQLRLAEAGEYFLWGRVLSPTPEDDSFFVTVAAGRQRLVSQAAWHLGTHRQWTWTRFSPDASRPEASLQLPAGGVTLQLDAREDGTKIDRLFLSPGKGKRPPNAGP